MDRLPLPLLQGAKKKHPQVRQDVTAKGKIDEAFGGELKKILTSFKQEYGYTTK